MPVGVGGPGGIFFAKPGLHSLGVEPFILELVHEGAGFQAHEAINWAHPPLGVSDVTHEPALKFAAGFELLLQIGD